MYLMSLKSGKNGTVYLMYVYLNTIKQDPSESSGIGHFTWEDRVVGTTELNASGKRNKGAEGQGLYPFPNHREMQQRAGQSSLSEFMKKSCTD